MTPLVFGTKGVFLFLDPIKDLPMTSTTTRLLINGGAAPKTGAHSSGAVLYRLFTDAARSDVFIAITGNEGGSGYFSREAVPFSKVMQCVTGRPDAQQPLASKALMAVFQGRSTNNGGFLAAILRHLGLLAPAPEAAHQHVPVGDWEAWRQQQLNAPAEPFLEPASLTPPASGEDIPPAAPVDVSLTLKGQKGTVKGVKPIAAATPTDAGDHDADLA